MASISTIAPAYGPDYRDTSRSSLSIVRPSHGHHHHAPVVDETFIEHEHHHLHHHIDHGDVNGRLAMARVERPRSRPGLGREYSYDDLDLRERRYANGTAVTTISHSHDHSPRSRRHRHRHRSRRGSVERTRYTRSEVDLGVGNYNRDSGYVDDDLTVIDVPAGTRRVYVNVEKSHRDQSAGGSVDWRRERGVRRSRGLGNELWTEITKDLVTREAIEDLGYAFEETDYFYYIFEYLDKDQIAELRELTDDIRHERVRDIEYQSISGSQYGGDRMDRDHDDSRTEIIIENSGHRDRHRRRYFY
ncbi:hypothetical protein K440DRAFT_626735 [Wilcoxina mikolae CBS 423.85]|nr:hypothetical protein K440DRAFT_626735 [Wilcoxina mikolae CBS 423.85]